MQWLPRKDERLPKIRMFFVWFGANDACLPPSPQAVRTHPLLAFPNVANAPAIQVTLEEFKRNLNTIMDLIRSPSSPHYSPSTQIVLITPPPVDAEVRNAELASRDPPRVPDRDRKHTQAFAEAVKEVARDAQVPSVDVWTKITATAEQQDGGKLDRYLSDGLHLTAEGYRLVTEGVSLPSPRNQLADTVAYTRTCRGDHQAVAASALGSPRAEVPALGGIHPSGEAVLRTRSGVYSPNLPIPLPFSPYERESRRPLCEISCSFFSDFSLMSRYSASWVSPSGGLHPALRLDIDSTPSPSCALYTHLSLPPHFIADKFQLHQLHREGMLGAYDVSSGGKDSFAHAGETDLEAPVWRASEASVLIRVHEAEDKVAGAGSRRTRVDIPLHLRYQVPVEARGADGTRQDIVEVEFPYPRVFWACPDRM